MAILDNILALDTYGLKYGLTYYDIHGQEIVLEIYKRDYSGSRMDVVLLGDGLTLQKNFSDEDFFQSIVGTQFQLNLIARDIDIYREFSVGDNRQYPVKLLRGGTPLAFGYILPETYEENFGALPHIISVTVADGLGLLKDDLFENNDYSKIIGMERVSDIISFILNKTGLWNWSTGFWIDYIPIQPTLMESGMGIHGCLYNLFVECSYFYEMSCAEVLTQLISAFNAKVTQLGSGFMVFCPDQFVSNTGQPYDRYGQMNGYNSTYSHDYLITGIEPDGRIADRVTLRIDQNSKQIDIIQKKTFKNLVGDIALTDWVGRDETGNLNLEVQNDVIMFNCQRPNVMPEEHENSIEAFLNIYDGSIFYPQPQYLTLTFDYLFIGTVIDDPELEYTLKAVMVKSSQINWSLVGEGYYMQQCSPITINKTGVWESGSIRMRYAGFNGNEVSLLIAVQGVPTYTLLQLKNISLIMDQPIHYTTFETEYKNSIRIQTNNKNILSFDKYYGNRILADNVSAREEWAFANQFFCYTTAYILASTNWQSIEDQKLTTLRTFIQDKYNAFYLKNKKRVTFGLVNFMDYQMLYPYTQLLISELRLKCYLLGYEWNLKLDTYQIEALEYDQYLQEVDYQVYHEGMAVQYLGLPVIHNGEYRAPILDLDTIPSVQSAETNTAGNTIILTFNIPMSASFVADILLAFVVSSENTVTKVERGTDTSQILIAVTPNILEQNECLLNYNMTYPIYSLYGVLVQNGFDDLTVTNNSLAHS